MTILAFTRTTGYRHESIPAGLRALSSAFDVTATEDLPLVLDPYAVVVFLNTSGDVLSPAQRSALQSYVGSGGGFVGVHCAAHTETGWPYFRDLIGARFTDHPPIQPAVIRVPDRDHPATAHLEDAWPRTDEWYNFDARPASSVRVLLTVDESTYSGGTMGAPHPLAWCHTSLGGRSFYTALGHAASSYEDPLVQSHLHGAVHWASR